MSYANATILGGDTVIGNGSRMGGNVWLTRSVSAHSVVTPAVRIDARTRRDELLEFNTRPGRQREGGEHPRDDR